VESSARTDHDALIRRETRDDFHVICPFKSKLQLALFNSTLRIHHEDRDFGPIVGDRLDGYGQN
jgi:hypothetical protein